MELDATPQETISPAEERFERIRRRSGFFLAPAGFLLTLWWTSAFLSPEASRLSAGLIFDLLGFTVIWCGLRIMCPLLGLT